MSTCAACLADSSMGFSRSGLMGHLDLATADESIIPQSSHCTLI
jgi:hypothetical protein